MSKRPKLDFLPLIPPELLETHRLMERYADWARAKFVYRTCYSLEGRYRAPKWEGEPVPGVMMPSPEAWRIHKAIVGLPITHRAVLFAQYRADDHGTAQRHCIRHGIRRPQDFHRVQVEGLLMIKNRLQRLTLSQNL